MAPNCPEEVDVFTVPHSRMKQLVHSYLDLVSASNFRDEGRMTSVLEILCHTFHVFKAHEQIENRYIMRRLKEKMIALDIRDAAVCNCHSDNRLTEMLAMVLDGYRWAQRGERERVQYGLRLRRALEDFTQVFIPHMKEEEEVFQPMLVEYFTYDELKELKAKVIQQHVQKEEEASGKEKCVPECDCDSDKEEEGEGQSSALEQLPVELTLKIFSYLSPQDLCRCAQVSRPLNHLAMDPSLWRTILPVQWAAGEWSFIPAEEKKEKDERKTEEEEEEACSYLHDEDADKDESSDSDSSESQENDTMRRALREVRVVSGLVRHLLPKVGGGVERAELARSRGISSSLVHRILKLCPNLKVLNLAHTRITDAAFKEYGLKGWPCQLEHLDLSSCENITDSTLHSLAGNHAPTPDSRRHVAPPPLPCHSKTRHPSTVVVRSSLDDCECDPTVGECTIVPDGSYTECISLEVNQVPAAPRFCSSSGGPVVGLGTDSVSGCGVNRTCCRSRGKAEGSGSTTGGIVGSQEEEEEGKPGGEDKPRQAPHALHRLTHLSLNGCYNITDEGLRALSERGGLPQAKYLDLSGCLHLTGKGVASLVDTCHSLDHAFLFYCDNVFPDPYPATASGCRNLECSSSFCCRSGD